MTHSEEAQVLPTRNEIRAKILGSNKLKRVPLQLFDMEVEVRQPNVGEIVNTSPENDTIINWLIDYVYVAGSDEKVFDETDRATLQTLPYGPELRKFSKVMIDFLGGNMEEVIKQQAKN